MNNKFWILLISLTLARAGIVIWFSMNRLHHNKLVWEQPPGNTWWGYPIPESWYRWQLYDLDTDPGEANDLSSDNPELVAELAELWEDYATAHNVVRDVRLKNFERWHPASADN